VATERVKSVSSTSQPKQPPVESLLRIGANFPNFTVSTTQGNFELHKWLKGDGSCPWTILMSHPRKMHADVCTTELAEAHARWPDFQRIRTKLIGLSCDTTLGHKSWSKDAMELIGRPNEELAFPLIADPDRSIVTELGMIDPSAFDEHGLPLPARCLIILFGNTVRLATLYPVTIGRSIDELFRVITSLQVTRSRGLATPANWKQGDRVIVAPSVDTKEAKAKYEDFQIEQLPSGQEYLRTVKCPPTASGREEKATLRERRVGRGAQLQLKTTY